MILAIFFICYLQTIFGANCTLTEHCVNIEDNINSKKALNVLKWRHKFLVFSLNSTFSLHYLFVLCELGFFFFVYFEQIFDLSRRFMSLIYFNWITYAIFFVTVSREKDDRILIHLHIINKLSFWLLATFLKCNEKWRNRPIANRRCRLYMVAYLVISIWVIVITCK